MSSGKLQETLLLRLHLQAVLCSMNSQAPPYPSILAVTRIDEVCFSVNEETPLERVSETRTMAKEVFAYIYGNAEYRARFKTNPASQERIRSLLEEAMHTQRLVSVYAYNQMEQGNDFNLASHRGRAYVRQRVGALNKKFAEYPTVVKISLLKEDPFVEFKEVFTAPKERPAREALVARLIFALCEDATILQISWCQRRDCRRFFFSPRLSDKFCCTACRTADFSKSPERKAIRAAQSQIKYHDELARSARHVEDRAKALKHDAKAKSARERLATLTGPKR